jgi:hypothetical protein
MSLLYTGGTEQIVLTKKCEDGGTSIFACGQDRYWCLPYPALTLIHNVYDIITYMDSWQGIWVHIPSQSLYSPNLVGLEKYTFTGNMNPYTRQEFISQICYYCIAINIEKSIPIDKKIESTRWVTQSGRKRIEVHVLDK